MIEEIERVTHIGKGVTKLYVTIDIGPARVARTRPLMHALPNPKWDEKFFVFCAYEANEVVIELKDELAIGAVVVGKAQLSTVDLLRNRHIKGGFDLLSPHPPHNCVGKLYVKFEFRNVKSMGRCWGEGITGDEYNGVPHSFFREERGNKVTLYQDSHMKDGFMPEIILDRGFLYKPTRCWEDIYTALSEARHFIYIAGWSVFTHITLVRDPKRMIPGAEGLTLGDLLKRKAEEGVRVLLLVWDDRTSFHGERFEGIMHTHDEDTAAYFRGSKVHCVLCPRNPDDGSTIVQGIEVGLLFTHHQKTVTVDVCVSQADTRRRKLVCFLGGIDLCDGRYDEQHHYIFKTLNTVHAKDFHQPNFKASSLKFGGPREPWHDVHARIEGPAAWDVLKNFEQRWKKQGEKSCCKYKKVFKWIRSDEVHLLSLQTIPELWPPHKSIDVNGTEAWNAQIFRSIDEGAVQGFQTNPVTAAQMGLVHGKENIIDRSIQDAYICAIRRAKHFIYIENQFFIGSSASWSSHQDSGAIQLIPMELTQKIVSKIEEGERFAVYVVIPMWPEGIPESSPVQDILYWQKLTMEMMYKRIAAALIKKGILGTAVPTDYLNFFCLGTRETGGDQVIKTPESEDYRAAQEHKRFMIYVHAKTMIVDDEYIIVGSANCNQRSMDGARDSEIAVGAYQPNHLMESSPTSRPRGQVYGFRMSLWYEHTRRIEDEFEKPESIASVKKMQAISQELWSKYTQATPIDMKAHLLPYPIAVLPKGEITNLSGYENFPDTKASVLGTRSRDLPPMLTV
ncbi:hypothetical protein KP509_02G078700 [Ceratopteris richardii]|nr:hypothetical protein KP509_02G078700 [Ceratopteris richardii]